MILGVIFPKIYLLKLRMLRIPLTMSRDQLKENSNYLTLVRVRPSRIGNKTVSN